MWRGRSSGAPCRIQSCIALTLEIIRIELFIFRRVRRSIPTILLVVANLRVFFATPMIAPGGCVLGGGRLKVRTACVQASELYIASSSATDSRTVRVGCRECVVVVVLADGCH